MPVPNDLSAEEEREFAQHGVQSRGPGSEPVIEGDGDVQQGQQTEGGQPVIQQQSHGDREVDPQQFQQPQQQQETQTVDREALRATIDPRRENGQFKSKEEIDAELDQLVAGQQGQQPQQQGQQQTPPPGFVPHQALHETRQKMQEFARQNALLTARMNAILTAQQQQQPQQQMPDLAENPAEYIQRLEERVAQFEEAQRREAEYRQIDQGLEQDEAIFAQSVPDYEQASEYYANSRARELLQFYPPDEAHRLLVQEARAIATNAWQRGMSAGQAVYQLAQARGYNPNINPANNQQQFQPQMQNAPQQQQQPQQGQAAAQIAALQNNQQKGPRSIGGGGGAVRTAALNAEAVLQMSDEEFERYVGLGTRGANERFAAIG